MDHAGDLVPALRLPDPRRAIPTPADHVLPVRAEGDVRHIALMGHAGNLTPRLCLPHPRRAFDTILVFICLITYTADHVLPIRAEGDGGHRIVMGHAGVIDRARLYPA